jgi:hypothetical protein
MEEMVMKWTNAMGTLLLGCAFLLSGGAARVEGQDAVQPEACYVISDPGFEFYPLKEDRQTPSAWVAIPANDVIGAWGNPYMGSQHAWLNGYGRESTNWLMQLVPIPADALQATLSFRLQITTAEPSGAPDTLEVMIRNNYAVLLVPLETYSNADAAQFSTYTSASLRFDARPFRGQRVQVYFLGHEDSHDSTSFFIDNVGLCITRTDVVDRLEDPQ